MIRHLQHRRRGGIILMAVLICVTLAAVLFVATLGATMARYRQVQKSQLEMQAVWLTEAGIERAAARLASDVNFTGETWHITAEQLGGRYDGVVHTVVQRDEALPNRYLVSVTADYPKDEKNRVRKSKTFNIDTSRSER